MGSDLLENIVDYAYVSIVPKVTMTSTKCLECVIVPRKSNPMFTIHVRE